MKYIESHFPLRHPSPTAEASFPMTALAITTTESLTIRPWPDDVIDALGHDPRSAYVETYWLGILGPSTTWLLRLLVAGLEANPAGFDLPPAETPHPPRLRNKG